MKKYDIHVCVISSEAAANLLPILDDKFMPQKAIFLVSKEMEKEAYYLEKVFNAKGLSVIHKSLSNVWDFDICQKEIGAIAEEYKDSKIALNATGGNKILSIAAYCAFSKIQADIFYVNTNHKKILFLSRDENVYSKEILLEAKGEIDLYLSAYGIKVIKDNHNINNKFVKEMADCFIHNYSDNRLFLGKINRYAVNMKADFKSILTEEDLENEKFIFTLMRLKNVNKGKGIIGYENGTIDFRNPDIRFFMNGGWLEDYIYQQVSEIKSINGIYCGLKVDNNLESKSDKIFDNELDIVFMASNKLFIIECKGGKINSSLGNDILNKLERLKKYGGAMTKACLVAYDNEIPPKIIKKAKDLHIEIIAGEKIAGIKEHIQSWILKR